MKSLLLIVLLSLGINFGYAQTTPKIYDNLGYTSNEIIATDNGFEIHTIEQATNSLRIMQTDMEGNMLSAQQYFENSGDLSFKDGFFYSTGESGTAPNRDIQFSKLDSDGNLVWEKTIENPRDNYGVKIIPTTDGGLLIAGVAQVGGDTLYAIQLTKTNETGEVLWQSYVDNNATFYDKVFGYYLNIISSDVFPIKEPPIKLLKEVPTGFVINNSAGYDSGGVLSHSDNIIKIDHYGRTQWNQSFLTGSKNISDPVPSVNYQGGLADIEGYEDGSVVMCFNTKIGTAQDPASFAVKIDNQGERIWGISQGTGHDWPGIAYAITPRQDGGAWWVVYNGANLKELAVYGIEALPIDDQNYVGGSQTNYAKISTHYIINDEIADFFGQLSSFSNYTNFNSTDIIPLDEGFAITGDFFEDSNTYSPDRQAQTFFLKEQNPAACISEIDGFTYIGKHNNHQYFFSREKYTPSQADSMAQANGGHLASVNTRSENDFLDNFIFFGHALIGINDADTEGSLSWENGDPVDFTNFADCETPPCNDEDIDFVVLNNNTGQWSYVDSEEKDNFFLEIDCNQTPTSKADIAIKNIETTEEAYGGELINIQFDLANIGSEVAQGDYDIKIYLSTNSTIDDEDIELTTITTGNTAPHILTPVSSDILIPEGLEARYYNIIIIADIDDSIDEINESNNLLTSFFGFQYKASGPDLTITNLENPFEDIHTVYQGDVFYFDFDLNNEGNEIANGEYEIKFYLLDYWHSNSDTEEEFLAEGAIHVGTVPTGYTSPGTITGVTAGITITDDLLGRQYLYAFIDATENINETTENNNIFEPRYSNYFNVFGNNGPDIALSSWSNFPTTIAQGETLDIDYVISNIGTKDIEGEYSIRYSIHSNPVYCSTCKGGGELLSNTAVGEEIPLNLDFRIPISLDPGFYYINFYLDNGTDVNESNENNNRISSSPIQVTAIPSPDLSLSNLTNLNAVAVQGEVMTFNFDLNNFGTTIAAGDYNINMYLRSTSYPYLYILLQDPNSIAGVVPTGYTGIGTIANVPGAITVPPFIEPGEYYLILYADTDQDIEESNEDNNALVSEFKIQINASGDPFEMSIGCPEVVNITVGANEIGSIVEWDDNLVSSSFNNCNQNLNYELLSQNSGILNGSFFPLGSSTVSYAVGGICHDELATASCSFDVNVLSESGGSIAINCPSNLDVQIPLGSNSIVGDWDTPTINSSCSVGSATLVQIGGPSLGSNLSEGAYTIEYAATDQCGNMTTCSFNIEVAASAYTTTISCSNDTIISSTSPDGLAYTWVIPTSSTDCPSGVNLQQTTGPANGSVLPLGNTQICYEASNASCSTSEQCCFYILVEEDTTISILPDITVDNLNDLASVATQGSVIGYLFDLSNDGNTNVNGDFDVMMYLSADESFGENDIEVGIVPTGNIGVGTIEDVYAAIRIPDNLPEGDYYLIIVADRNDAIEELDETNNILVSSNPINVVIKGTIAIDCPSDIFIQVANGQTMSTANWNLPDASTTCGISNTTNITQTSGPSSGAMFGLGSTNISYDIVDECGNTSSCSFEVNVSQRAIFTNTVEIELCQGSSYEGIVYDQDATLMETIAFEDFDSIITTNISIQAVYEFNISGQICEGESFEFGGNNYTTAGLFTENYMTNSACDSTININLTVNPVSYSEIIISTCNPNEVGTDTITFSNALGCDSIIVMKTELLPSSTYNLATSICEDEEIIINGTTYNAINPTGTEILSEMNQFGCDSIININLTIKNNSFNEIVMGTCNANEVGTDTIIFSNAVGCDSVIVMRTELLSSSTFDLETSICETEEIIVNEMVYNANNPSGIEILSGMNQFGCDSTVNINLAIIDNQYSNDTISLNQGDAYNGVIIENDTSFITTLTGSNGCDSIATTFVMVNIVGVLNPNNPFVHFELYPNPTRYESIINIQLFNNQLLAIEVYTVGQRVKSLNIDNNQSNPFRTSISQLTSGAYIIVVKTEKGMMTKRLVVL